MSTQSILPDDPRLTAYALGEMDSVERQEFERILAAQPEAQAWIEEIRSVADSLESSLRDEPMPAAVVVSSHVLERGRARRRPAILRFPQLYFVVSGLAAACFAVFVAVRDRPAAGDEAGKKVLADMGNRAARESPGAMPAVATDESATMELTGTVAAPEDTFFPVADAETSTFPLHVGRESYQAVRDALTRGRRPAPATVRVAEMINAFSYAWPAAKSGEPFASVLEESAAPWNPKHRLVRIGLKATGHEGTRVADDARVEVQFNARQVAAWRLIGFDGGQPAIGLAGVDGEPMFGGSAITVLYELIPVAGGTTGDGTDLLTVALRYRQPDSESVESVAWHLAAGNHRFEDASPDMKFVAAVAAFGIGLRGTDPAVAVPPPTVADWAASSASSPERAEFLGLMRASGSIQR
ncbi:MAG TPA: von Willebrand factor type A domain-containing protein [Candidatus Didemnitutus sp.]|nr:von Willebrand factor type A domain-containing protein [Candidatus Didemnitutus sp.]